MLLKLTWEYLRHHKMAVVTITVLQIAQSLISLSLPRLTADIINEGVIVGDVTYIWNTGATMIGLTIIQAICLSVTVFIASRISMDFGQQLRERTFQKVLTLTVIDIQNFGPSSLITRATNDVRQLQTLLYMTFTILVMAPIIGVGGVIMSIREDAKLSLLLVVVVPLLITFITVMIVRLSPMFTRLQKLLDETGRILREQLTGVRVVRAFNRQEHERLRFENINKDLYDQSLKISYLFSYLFPTISLIMGLSFTAVLWFGAGRISIGEMPVGALVAYINYLMQIMISVLMVSMIFFIMPRARVSADRIAAVLATDPQIKDPTHPKPFPNSAATFTFENVTVEFGNAEEATLKDINLTLKPGTITALIGPTGAGKTTLVNLLPRLIDPSRGNVFVSDENSIIKLANLSLDELRSRVAIVPQTTYLFKGTIASNIACVAVTDVTDIQREQTRKCLEIADAWEFVSKLELGVDTQVGIGGSGYSGGQRQRLTIARGIYQILYGQAQLLVIDDSFSALDLATEARVRENMRFALKGTTMLIVAQRLSTIRNADQIAVIERGQIVGLGTHDSLLRNCALYADIVTSQAQIEKGIVA